MQTNILCIHVAEQYVSLSTFLIHIDMFSFTLHVYFKGIIAVANVSCDIVFLPSQDDGKRAYACSLQQVVWGTKPMGVWSHLLLNRVAD